MAQDATFSLFVVVLEFIRVMRPIASQEQTCGTDYTIKEGENARSDQGHARRVLNRSAVDRFHFLRQPGAVSATNVSLLVPDVRCGFHCVGGEDSKPHPLPPHCHDAGAEGRAGAERGVHHISCWCGESSSHRPMVLRALTASRLAGVGMLTQVIAGPMGARQDEAKGPLRLLECRGSMTGSAHLNPRC